MDQLQHSVQWLDQFLLSFKFSPLQWIVISIIGFVILKSVLAILVALPKWKQELIPAFFRIIKKVPFLKGVIEKEKNKYTSKLKNVYPSVKSDETVLCLPKEGISTSVLVKRLEKLSQEEHEKDSTGKISGTIYMKDEEHEKLLAKAYELFMHANPLHADIFPATRKFESEVIAMTIAMLHGDVQKGHCGALTSGGTESICMALKAYRDYARNEKGIETPEVIAAETVHAAFDKGCHYFGMKLIKLPVSQETFKLDPSHVKKYINRNTILIVASAPHFPQGIIDPVEELGTLAQRYKLCLHVDCCLGGFYLPFAAKLRSDIPKFDFQVPGVTSISADTHKFGLSTKGSSVLLFSSKDLRKHMYSLIPRWTGGMYATPTLAGSRPGALIATCWTALMHMGESGYIECTQRIMQTVEGIKKGIKDSIPELKVLGDPKAMVVSFAAKDPKKLNIFNVGDAMTQLHWNLNTLQYPASIHICITNQTAGCEEEFISDLKQAVHQAVNHPEKFKSGMAPIYGAAISIPDSSLVGDLMSMVIDSMLDISPDEIEKVNKSKKD